MLSCGGQIVTKFDIHVPVSLLGVCCCVVSLLVRNENETGRWFEDKSSIMWHVCQYGMFDRKISVLDRVQLGCLWV